VATNHLYRVLKNVHENRGVPAGETGFSINHDDCPAGTDTRGRLNIKAIRTGLIGHCFNCGNSGWYWYNKEAVLGVDDLRHREVGSFAGGNKAKGTLQYIADRWIDITDLSIRAWLYQQRLTDDDIVALGAGQALEGTLVLPLGPDITVSGAVTRYFGMENDFRYRLHLPDDALKCKYFNNNRGTLVITEDIISAYRVQKNAPVDSIALLGTSLSSKLTENLAGYRNFIIWLDEDFAGQEAIFKVAKVIHDNVAAAQCYVVMNKQAKKLSDEEINKEIMKWL